MQTTELSPLVLAVLPEEVAMHCPCRIPGVAQGYWTKIQQFQEETTVHNMPARHRAPFEKHLPIGAHFFLGPGRTHSITSPCHLPVHALKDTRCTYWRKTFLQPLPEVLCTNFFCAHEREKCPVIPANHAFPRPDSRITSSRPA